MCAQLLRDVCFRPEGMPCPLLYQRRWRRPCPLRRRRQQRRRQQRRRPRRRQRLAAAMALPHRVHRAPRSAPQQSGGSTSIQCRRTCRSAWRASVDVATRSTTTRSGGQSTPWELRAYDVWACFTPPVCCHALLMLHLNTQGGSHQCASRQRYTQLTSRQAYSYLIHLHLIHLNGVTAGRSSSCTATRGTRRRCCAARSPPRGGTSAGQSSSASFGRLGTAARSLPPPRRWTSAGARSRRGTREAEASRSPSSSTSCWGEYHDHRWELLP